MFKILKLKGANIRLIYLIAFLIILWATFMPAFTTQDPSRSDFSADIYTGYYFTHVTLIFYLIGVILIFFRRPTASFVLTVIGNAILSMVIIYFLAFTVGTIEKGEIWHFYYGFYIILFIWIVLIILNILIYKFKSELSVKPSPDQPVNN